MVIDVIAYTHCCGRVMDTQLNAGNLKNTQAVVDVKKKSVALGIVEATKKNENKHNSIILTFSLICDLMAKVISITFPEYIESS